MATFDLMDPVLMEVEPIDKASSVQDDDMREPVQIVKRLPVVRIMAQVEYREFSTHGTLAEVDLGGLKEGEQGYVAVRVIDYVSESWAPAIGDRITDIGIGGLANKNFAGGVYVSRLKFFAHHPVIGALGLKLYFTDQKPSRN